MPLFAFGGQFPPGPSPFRGVNLEEEARRARDAQRIFDFLAEQAINKGLNKGFEELLGYVKPVTFLPGEIASGILEPTPAGQGEEAAIAAMQERERQRSSAGDQLGPTPRIPVQRADP